MYMRRIGYPYWAGIIDGEGSMTIKVQHLPHCTFGKNHQLLIKVGMCNREIPETLHGLFGGSFVIKHPEGSRGYVYTWSITAKKALAFLLRIRPYLIVKKRHADLLIEFQKTMRKRGGRGRPLSKEMFAKREWYKAEITSLNIKPGKATSENPAKSGNPVTDHAVGNPEPSWRSIDESLAMSV